MTNCPPRGLLDGFEESRGPERAAVLEHVLGCGSCRAAWLAADPSRLFAFLALQPVPPHALESVSAEVSSAVRETIPKNGWAGARVFRPLAWAAAVLVAVLLGSLLFRPASGPPPSDLVRNVRHRTAFPAAGVELLSSPGAARVVDLTVGETQVVMIFDERIGL